MDKQPPDTIRKLHALVQHPNTPEHEREQARKALERLMRKWNLTEEDLSSEVRVDFTEIAKNKAESSLIFRVLIETLDRCDDLRTSFSKGPKRGQETFYFKLTITEQCDFRACLEWYRRLLANDLSDARQNLKRLKLETLTKLKVAQLAIKEIPSAFVRKYEIGEKVLIRRHRETAATQATTTAPAKLPPVKRMTAKEQRDADLRWKARRAAENSLSDGSRWEKPIGNVGSGQKQLSNGTKELSDGEDDFRLEA